MGKAKKVRLPQGCVYPDCFNCPLSDCTLPDDVDLLGDCDIVLEVEELKEQRDYLKTELQQKGISTKTSVEYHKISSRIHYLENRDIKKFRNKQWYDNHKK